MVAFSGCVSPALEMGRLIKGIALPEQWNRFLDSAERGEIEEVADTLPALGEGGGKQRVA